MKTFEEYSEEHIHLYEVGEIFPLLKNSILSLRKTKNKINIVDLGCGDGNLLNQLFHEGTIKKEDSIYALDPSQTRLDRIKNPNFKKIRASGGKTKLKGSNFDYVICTQVLEHIKEPHLVIKEMYRILKKGGKVFLTTHGNFEEHGIPYDFFRYTRYGLKYLAISNHFRSTKIKPQGGRFIAVAKFIQTLIPRILKNRYLVYIYYSIAMVPIFFIHLVFFYLDKLDKDKSLTLNYECIFVK